MNNTILLRILILFILILTIGHKGTSQEVAKREENIIATSPSAAASLKEAKATLKENIGVPIPIHTVSTKRLSAPISLSFSLLRLSTEEQVSWVGAGWSLNAGGFINQLPDQNLTQSVIDSDKQGVVEPTLDHFYLKVSTKSGKLVFSPDKKAQFLDKTGLEILECPLDNSSTRWILQDTSGIQYRYAQQVLTAKEDGNSSLSSSSINKVNTWCLRSMQIGDEWIRFEYAEEITDQIDKESAVTNHLTKNLKVSPPSVKYASYLHTARLTKISSSNGWMISFVPKKESRLDLAGSHALSRIEVSFNGQLMKSYRLSTSYFNNAKLRLDSLTQIDDSQEELPAYVFEYPFNGNTGINFVQENFKNEFNRIVPNTPLSINKGSLNPFGEVTDDFLNQTEVWSENKNLVKGNVDLTNKAEEVLDENSHRIAKKEISKKRLTQAKAYKAEIKNYKDSLKSLSTLTKEKKRYLLSKKKDELIQRSSLEMEQELKGLVAEKDKDFNKLEEVKRLEEKVKALSHADQKKILDKAKEKGVNSFKPKAEVLDKALKKSNELKKKYESVKDGLDLASSVKRKSLHGRPLRDRLILGGTYRLLINQNSSLALNPELGYAINKDFSLTAGGTYRLSFDQLAGKIDQNPVFGYRFFAEQRLLHSLFLHVEYERLKGTIEDAILPAETDNNWQRSFLAGLEKRIRKGKKTQGQLSVLYNFSFKQNRLYQSPWVFRFGFNISKK